MQHQFFSEKIVVVAKFTCYSTHQTSHEIEECNASTRDIVLGTYIKYMYSFFWVGTTDVFCDD